MLQQTPSIIAGIDIGSHMTRVIITEHAGSDTPPRVIGVGRSETNGMNRGTIVDESDSARSLARAIRMAEQMSQVSLERAYVCVDGISLETHHVTGSIQIQKKEVSPKDIQSLIEQVSNQFHYEEKNRTILHCIPLVYFLDNQELSVEPLGLSGTELSARFSIVSCLTQHSDTLLSIISKTGIDTVDLIASPIAASVITLSKRARTAGAAIVDIGSDMLTLSVFEHDALLRVATIACGSNLITNDLALGLQITLEEAELLKLGKKQMDKSKRKILDIIEARVMDIMEVVQKKLTSWNKKGLLPGGITLIGGGSQVENMETYAKTYLKLPAHVPNASKLIPCKKILGNAWLPVYGVCMLGDQKPQFRATGMNIKKIFKDTKGMIKDLLGEFLP
jgi:cell division protein FtsA